jgi:hypothetical protein
MFAPLSIQNELQKHKLKSRKEEDKVLQEVNKILYQDLLSERKILANLKHYSKSFEVINEEESEEKYIFTLSEIKKIAVGLRLRFLDSSYFKGEIPYEAVLKIKDINTAQGKDLKQFKILTSFRSFNNRRNTEEKLLFVTTNSNNYYLLHRWGIPLKWYHKLLSWPLRNFETLVITLLACTLILTLSLPTGLISLDPKAEYWSGWRIATFFHLFIFSMGVAAYITFAFSKNFHSSMWNSNKDF